MIADWPVAEILKFRSEVPTLGLRGSIAGRSVHLIARDLVAISRKGLRARARLGSTSRDESIYLDTLVETVERGETPAERLLDRYRDAWNGDIHELFRRYAY